jgi:serine/threonine-protein kinase
MIQLRLFGTVVLRANDGRELRSVVVQPKRLALLAYLAAAPAGRHRRDTVLAVFWPDLDTTHARGALNKSLHYLRRSLGENVVVSHGDEELAVDTDRLWCDLRAFDQALAAGQPGEALAHYHGDLLQGLHLSDTPEFERWLDQEREQYRRRAAAAAWALAGEAEGEGNLAAAVDWGRRAFAIAGDDEAALRRLLALLDAAGDKAGAVRLYEDFARRLLSDYDLEPAAETQDLVADLRATSVRRPPAQHSPPAALPRATPLPVLEPQRRPARLTGRLTLLAAAVIASIAVGVYQWRSRPEATSPGTPRVVVAPLDNRTGDASLNPLGNMAADWIIQGLAQTGLVEVVPYTSTLMSSRNLLGIADGGGDTAEQARTLARETGARIVVSGSYYLQGDSIHLYARIVDVVADRVLEAFAPVHAATASPLDAVEVLRQRVMAGLAPHVNLRISAYATRMHPTPSYDAYREYAEGVDRFVATDWRGAIEHFTRASAHDTAYTLPLVMAAIAYSNLGDMAAVDSLGRLIEPHRDRLAEYDRHAITAALAWTRGDYAASHRAAQRLAELAPNTMPHAQVARELLMVNRPREALRVLEELDPDRGELRGWFPYWNNLTTAHHLLGDARSELQVAREVSRRFPDNPTALQLEPRALLASGRVGEALTCLEDHLARLGPTSAAAFLLRQVALELHAHGEADAAQRLLARSLAWYLEPPPDVTPTPAFRRGLAEALHLAGEYARAQEVLSALADER